MASGLFKSSGELTNFPGLARAVPIMMPAVLRVLAILVATKIAATISLRLVGRLPEKFERQGKYILPKRIWIFGIISVLDQPSKAIRLLTLSGQPDAEIGGDALHYRCRTWIEDKIARHLCWSHDGK